MDDFYNGDLSLLVYCSLSKGFLVKEIYSVILEGLLDEKLCMKKFVRV